MIEPCNFKGAGMDTDSDPSAIQIPDLNAVWNTRFTGTVQGESDTAVNLESNSLISSYRPAGLNKCIGAEKFEVVRKSYAFIYNSQGFHLITEFNYDTLTESVIFTNKTDSNGIDILPLDPRRYICDIKLIQEKFLAFTDGDMQPCCINLERLKSGGYGIVTLDDFRLIKAQPQFIPTSVYADDATRSTNLMRGKLFQYAEYYTYLDYEDSTLSSYSKREVPESESTPSVGTDVTKSNCQIVSVPIGTNRVKTINVGARYDLLDWLLIKSIERTDILNLPATIDIPSEVYEAYDPGTGIYSFVFYNDGSYINLPVLFTDLPYDYVPQKVETLELINATILALANITEGYPRPSIDVQLEVSSYDPGITNPPADNTTALKVFSWGQMRPSGVSYRRVRVDFKGLPKTGDKITIITSNLDGVVYNQITHTVTVSENNNLLLAIKGLALEMPYPTSVVTISGGVRLNFSTRRETETPDGNREMMKGYTIELANVGSGVSKSVPAIKTNSSYQLALACYDRYGRYMPISTDVRYVVKTPSYAQLLGFTPTIKWTINNPIAPADAVSYQWLISENNTHQNILDINGTLDNSLTNSDYWVFKINSLLKFNDNNSSSILNYEYSPGDRVTFNYSDTGSKVWYQNPSVDVDVVAFDIVVDETPDPDVTNYLLKVRKSAAIVTADLLGKNLLMQIYTPKQRSTTVDGETEYTATAFYEIGEQYPIVNGQFSVLNGVITDGDVYIKSRQLINSIDTNTLDTYTVEDFNFSDFYVSRFTSYGRPRTYFDTEETINKKASIRYSDQFIPGSKTNGISRFYGERIYGEGDGQTTSSYGGISKISLRDNILIVLQETKVAHIPVNISILEDQIEQQNVAISDKLFNYVRYIPSGTYGIGRAKESFAKAPDGTIYFVDPNNSVPVKDGYNGVQPISGKMTKFFKKMIQSAYKQGKKVIGFYNSFDDKNGEFGLSIETDGDQLMQITFSNQFWQYEDTYTVNPATLLETVPPTKGNVSINTTTGKATYTPNIGQTGSDNFSYSFVVGGVTTTKKECITITPGDKTPDPFYFLDLLNQELSTLVYSNQILVTGVNIPVAISITGGQYSVNGGTYTSAPGIVNENDGIEVRQTTSASFNTTTSAVLTVGTYSDSFDATTKLDTIPDAFSFTPVTSAELSTLYTSNSQTITGLGTTSPYTVTGGEVSINGGSFTSSPGTIAPGDSVRVRRTSSGSYEVTVTVTLTIGGVSGVYSITTKDTTPDPFTFTAQTGVNLSTVTTSNTITISGLGSGVSVPVTVGAFGEYSKNGGAFTTLAGTGVNGDTFAVRLTSSGSYLTLATTSLTVGSVSSTFNVTTKPDDIPDSFTFTDITNQNINTSYTSNTITVSGLGSGVSVSVSVAGGEYSKNGGGFTSATGTATNGDTFSVRRNSSGSYSTQVDATLTISSVSDTYSITTKTAPSVTINWSNAYDLTPYVSGVLIYVLNGSEQFREFNMNSGSVVVPAGSSVQFRQVSFPSAFPWPDNMSGENDARLKVDSDISGNLYDDTVGYQTIELHGSNYSWTALEGHTYTVAATTDSSMTGFDTYVAVTHSESLLTNFVLVDTTSSISQLLLEPFVQNNASYFFNMLSDANTMTANFVNNDSFAIDILITGVSSFSSTISLSAGASGNIPSIPKGGIEVTVTYYIAP